MEQSLNHMFASVFNDAVLTGMVYVAIAYIKEIICIIPIVDILV